jgi:uridine kinase
MVEKKVKVSKSSPRRTARVTLDDGSVWSAPVGTPLEEYFKAAHPELVPTTRGPNGDDKQTAVAAVVDGRLRELTYNIDRDVTVKPVLLSDSDGLRVYRRALSLLLIVAAKELFPERKITIDHSLPFGGYYCAVVEGAPFGPDEIEQIKARMQEIVAADEPIVRHAVPLEEAIRLFEERGDEDKLRLMESREKDYLILYQMRGQRDYFYGYMVPSTGYLAVFDLTHDGEGFILHYPRRVQPNRLQPITALPKLRSVFRETARWLELLGVEDIGALNQAIRQGRAHELILVAEALHESQVADVADAIVERQPNVRLVLIAGPSSSGKTTGSKRLAVQLIAHGLRPYPIGLDNYFVNREDTPLDEHGDYDYEHLHTVDLDLFNEQLLQLMDGQEVELARFNFITGRREWGDVVQLTPEHIIIVEGIHALNPELVRALPPERVFRLYVSCLTQLNIDRYNRVPTTDVRLLRRIVRDAAYRGYPAQETLSRWRSVRKGERRWIFPYQENANMMFNSALVYELPILRLLAEPLLLQVEPGSPQHIEAKRLLSFLRWVEPLKQLDLVPDNSLLREFIGSGILRDYTPGKPGELL